MGPRSLKTEGRDIGVGEVMGEEEQKGRARGEMNR